MANGKSLCHGLAFLLAGIEGVVLVGTLSLILSSLGQTGFNHFVDAGEFDSECRRGRLRIQARVGGDYVKSVPRKPGFTDALTDSQHQRKPILWNRTDPDMATYQAGGTLDEFSLRQGDRANEV